MKLMLNLPPKTGLRLLLVILSISSVYSSCCDKCPMMIRPNILMEFEGFTNQELTTLYLTGTHRSDTLFGFVDTSSRTAMIHWSEVPSVWNVQSDSLNWEEDIVVYDWEAKESNRCHCFIEGTVKLVYGGNFYNFHYEDVNDVKNHPLMIKK